MIQAAAVVVDLVAAGGGRGKKIHAAVLSVLGTGCGWGLRRNPSHHDPHTPRRLVLLVCLASGAEETRCDY